MLSPKERKALKVASLLVYEDHYSEFTFNGKKSTADYGLVLEVTKTCVIIEWLADNEEICEFLFTDNGVWSNLQVVE